MIEIITAAYPPPQPDSHTDISQLIFMLAFITTIEIAWISRHVTHTAYLIPQQTLRGKADKSESVKAQTTDLSDAIRAYHRKSDFNLSSPGTKCSGGKEEGSPTTDRSSSLGISIENLSLETPNGGRKRSVRLSSLEIMRAALHSIDIHNWSLFA